MPTPSERGKEKKKVRVPGGGVRARYFTGKGAKHACAVCKKALHGTPHGRRTSGVKKLAKSKRRPSVPFGGVLCTECRAQAFEEAAKVKYGGKEEGKVGLKIRKFVSSAMGGIE